jgi:hypothetical protein
MRPAKDNVGSACTASGKDRQQNKAPRQTTATRLVTLLPLFHRKHTRGATLHSPITALTFTTMSRTRRREVPKRVDPTIFVIGDDVPRDLAAGTVEGIITVSAYALLRPDDWLTDWSLP